MAAIQRFFIKQNDTRPTLRCILLDADELPVDLTAATVESVSYTHLTLPTNREV